MPKKDDKSDLRCGLVSNGCRDGKVTEDHWCYGCGFYVCDTCSDSGFLGPGHDVMEHQADD